jgi:hypothetical protein
VGTDFEACACPLCDAEAKGREEEIRSEVKCLNCGRYFISHVAARALDDLSGAGRAIATEALRAQVKMLHSYVEAPFISESDVSTAAGRLE